MSIKHEIIRALRQSDGPVSGEELSRKTGVSRVAVWKHIEKMRDSGYDIQASARGYNLRGGADFIYPWEFDDTENRVRFFPEVDSTMTVGKKLADQGASKGTLIIADRQTKGRGRLQRNWDSEKGGLYFTSILRPDMPVQYAPLMSFAAAIAVVHAIRETVHIDASIKWPNDILINGKKCAGILSELHSTSQAISYLNLGIGINVNNSISPETPDAVSLGSLAGRNIPRKALLDNFIRGFDAHIDQTGDEIINRWKTYSNTLNRNVVIFHPSEKLSGRAVGVERDGALLIEEDDGTIRKAYFGDCTYRKDS